MKTAEQLNLTPEEYESLLWVREQLQDNIFAHVPTWHSDDIPENIIAFNMAYAGTQEYSCGTVACIGGWMKLHMLLGTQANRKGLELSDSVQVDVDRYVSYQNRHNEALSRLFYPTDKDGATHRVPYEVITPAQAIQAIDNYLTTGEANWHEVLGI